MTFLSGGRSVLRLIAHLKWCRLMCAVITTSGKCCLTKTNMHRLKEENTCALIHLYMSEGTVPSLLPSKRQFFHATFAKFLLMGECWINIWKRVWSALHVNCWEFALNKKKIWLVYTWTSNVSKAFCFVSPRHEYFSPCQLVSFLSSAASCPCSWWLLSFGRSNKAAGRHGDER